MPHKKVFTTSGRYFKKIDWIFVQKLIDERLRGVEIAKRLGIHPQSFYARVFKEHGWHFSHWWYKRHLTSSGRTYDPYPEIKTLE